LSRPVPVRSFSFQMQPKPHLRVVSTAPELSPGEPVEFDALFARYGGYVARLAARLLGSGDAEIDDVVQDVFWLAWRRLRRIVDMIQARGWLATVTTRVVRRRLRRRIFRNRMLHTGSRSYEVPAPGASAEERAVLGRLYEVLETLPTNQRLAWSLRYLAGEPLDAVAAACGCSLATAKRRISAAKNVIDEVFRDE
jgi:RNA polymerase sigma-70 factor, ECF subfamily